MWFSFWRSRDRFSLDELRFLIDQLMKVQLVNEVNKDFVIEALRSIAELITYGDQHDPTYFELFMEKQVMGEFVRILKISRIQVISLQLLQTMSIMIQNLKCEHSIYYMFSNEHVNYLISYQFDFRNEELLSYYISFLRAISGKLNKDTISLLFKTQDDEVVSFPLYVEAIRFAFHEESMIRTAVRALTLNVYHVGDDAVNNFVSKVPHTDYFVNLVKFFRDQCIHLNQVVSNASKNTSIESTSPVLSSVDEIEDNLYYFSDVVSAGIPDVGRIIMDNVLKLLVVPIILPSLRIGSLNEHGLGAVTSLYLLCCILRILKIKDLANIVATALLCSPPTFSENSEAKLNGNMLDQGSSDAQNHESCRDEHSSEANYERSQASVISSSSSQNYRPSSILVHDCHNAYLAPREALLSFISSGNDVQVSGSLCVLATLLQTKELDELMVDALGILPQRKQHKKKLLQALVGEDSGEEQLFSSQSSGARNGICSDLDIYLQRLKDYTGVSSGGLDVGVSPRMHRFQVLDALVSLFCRSNVSAETLWDGGWLLRQLLPYSEAEFNCNHLRLLKESFRHCTNCVLEETAGTWSDHLVAVICDEWRKCKRAIEASSPRKDPKLMLLSSYKAPSEEFSLSVFLRLPEHASTESSFVAGERMCETVKVFVLLHHLHIFSLGRVLPDQPPVLTSEEIAENSRGRKAGVNASGMKPNTEINLVDALPCRIAFERGKERHFFFLAVSFGNPGWLVLAEEFPMKPRHGVVRVVAPLAGCNPRIDDKHQRWLHLRIRPSSFSLADAAAKGHGKVKSKHLVDGRWTLAFRDEDSCKRALDMILEETKLQSQQVQRSLQPLLEFDRNLKPASDSFDGGGTGTTS
ncbi:protein TRANSPARENT TESTA 9 isoform X2 [Andrographis paniculata]|uniref:protein TRANSPARENT TESTA 9 isoform X2 n=1 Tax=Andrographis paniculata TaxID=175694 RepID=UPI0021E92260|nr:protein TRANSPARENT TESTA 9 isoform X2 [Andrographis paniculata]